MSRAIDVVIGVVCRRDDDRVLICQRPTDTTFPGLWEFPGGKREQGETLEQCLTRELREELAIEVALIRALTTIEHDYPAARIRLHPYLCTHTAGDPRPLACRQFKWVTAPSLRDHTFPPANETLIEEVIEAIACVDFTGRNL